MSGLRRIRLRWALSGLHSCERSVARHEAWARESGGKFRDWDAWNAHRLAVAHANVGHYRRKVAELEKRP